VSGGTLVCGDVNALGSSSVTLLGGTLNLANFAINAPSITRSGGTLSNFAAYAGEVFVPGGTLVVPATAVGTYIASVGGTVDLASNNPPLTQLRYDGGTLINIGFYRGELRNDVAYTAPYDLRCSLFCAADFDLGGFQVAPASGSLSVYVESGYTLFNGTVSNCAVSLDNGNVSALIAGTSTVTVASAGSTNTLSGANTYSGGTSLSDGTLVAADDAAFGIGDITLDGGVLDFDGYSVATDVTVNGGDIANGSSYAGTATISPAVTFTIPVGAVLAGGATVSPTGKLAIAGQHTGTIDNSGEVEVDNATAANPPVNGYTGNCGSTYAVRAA
jgi:autotransporter-associated beta strand protein